MAKIITFSEYFPVYHPKQGQPTGFVSKILAGEKNHTIRGGKRWKEGDLFSPRVWTGKPYNSPMKCISEVDMKVYKTYDFKIGNHGAIYLNGVFLMPEEVALISKNDGLEVNDFLDWFKFPNPFDGQIICWNKIVRYETSIEHLAIRNI